MTSEAPAPKEENTSKDQSVHETNDLDGDSGSDSSISAEDSSNLNSDGSPQNSNQDGSNYEFTKNQSTQIADNEARLEQLEKEHETLKSQYMRIAADFDNFRKRQTRDQDDLRIQLTCNTLSEILPIEI